MNWKEIKEKYPKAYNIFELSLTHIYTGSHQLFSFFDENGIYILIQIQDEHYWDVDVVEKRKDGLHSNYLPTMGNRKEAEPAAFEKAFEILEERLNN